MIFKAEMAHSEDIYFTALLFCSYRNFHIKNVAPNNKQLSWTSAIKAL